MADSRRKHYKNKNQIKSFSDISSNIRSILSDFRKEIVEKIANDRFCRL